MGIHHVLWLIIFRLMAVTPIIFVVPFSCRHRRNPKFRRPLLTSSKPPTWLLRPSTWCLTGMEWDRSIHVYRCNFENAYTNLQTEMFCNFSPVALDVKWFPERFMEWFFSCQFLKFDLKPIYVSSWSMLTTCRWDFLYLNFKKDLKRAQS